MDLLLAAGATGFATSLSLILAIGAQNAFVLRQGILKQHVFWICLFCGGSDAILISAGVLGFGALVLAWPALPFIMSLAGALFLFCYGLLRFVAAYRGAYALEISQKSNNFKTTMLIAAAFTWTNPHVYLDTFGLIGAISTSFTTMSERLAFGLGAVSASFAFFFALGYGARALAPVMQSARSWRIFDIMVGIVMWLIASGLIVNLKSI